MATVTGTKRHLAITSTTYDSSGDVVVGGNLTVEGTTTTLDTANLLVEDKNIIIGNVSTPSDTTADGGGITLKGASDYTINWVNANDRWEFNQGIYSSGPITSAGQITGTELEGTSLDINGNADISGNITTATWAGAIIPEAKLQNQSGTNTGDQDLSGYSTSDTTYTAGNGLSLSGTEFRMAGGNIGGSVDLDTYTSSGYYVQGSNSQAASGTNWPAAYAGILTVVRAEGNTTHITQTYDQYNSNAFYNRSYYNGTWSSWRNLAQDTNTQRAIHDTPVDAATTTSISSNWAFDNVKTAVPANALFTDTTYNLSGYLLNTTDTLTGNLTIDTGGLIIEGSVDSGATDMGYYESAGTNIILKGDSVGRSGIFFESEKDGTNINDPSDYGFIQFHSYGYGNTTGEANNLVIGVSNDSTDKVILQAPYNGGVMIGYKDATSGTGLTLSEVIHSNATSYNNGDWDAAYTHAGSTHAPTNAEANVQSDWNATSGDALILNKPTIPAAITDYVSAANGGTFSGDITINGDVLLGGSALAPKTVTIQQIGVTSTETTAIMHDGNGVLKTRTLGTGAFGPTPVGAYLPLSAGSSYPLTGPLYITSDGGAANGAEIYLKHANNNTTDTIGTLFFGNNADATLSSIVVETNGANNTSNLKLNTSNAGTMSTALTLQGDNDAIFTGNVGIGTTTPTAPLHIDGGTNSEVLKIEADASPYIRWVENGTNVGFLQFLGDSAYLSNMGNGSLFFRTNNTDKMTITAGGNVGIGTTSPGAKLNVAGDVLIDSGEYISWGTVGATSIEGSTASNKLQFRTNSSDRMIIDSSGNVGIGTTTPYGKLDVAGSIRLQSDNQIYFGATASIPYWNVGVENTTNNNFEIAGVSYYSGDRDILLKPVNNGNVGINTTNPTSKLEVSGTINFNDSGDKGFICSPAQGTFSLGDIDEVSGGGYLKGTGDDMEWYNSGNKKFKVDLNGTVTASGDMIAYGSPSDKRLKENIKPIESALDKAMKLQGVTFDWKESDSLLDIKEDIGFIAQDVQKVVPELVRENADGMLSMRHQGIAPILLEAIKELKAEIDLLKSKPCTCNKCNCNI